MKNLIVTCSMLLCFGYAFAQETPQKTKQSKTKTDTVYNKKEKRTTEKSTAKRKTDTVSSNRTHQKKGNTTKTKGTETVPQRDSIIEPTRP